MKVFALFICQAILSFKLELDGFSSKDAINIYVHDKLYPIKLTKFKNKSQFTLKITTFSETEAAEDLDLKISGTGEDINKQLAENLFVSELLAPVRYNVTAEITDNTENKQDTLEYAFTVNPSIKLKKLHEFVPKDATFPFLFAEVLEPHKNEVLKINVEGEPKDVELAHENGHIVIKKANNKALNGLKFHAVHEQSAMRSRDILLGSEKKSGRTNKIQKGLLAASAVLVVVMLAALGLFYYRNMQANEENDEEKGNGPLFNSQNLPRQISLPVDTYSNTANVLDLKDANSK